MKPGQEWPARGEASGFRDRPPRRYEGPIFDAHTHTWPDRPTAELVEAARLYGITKLLVISPLDEGLRTRDTFPDEIEVATLLDWDHVDDPPRFARVNRRLLDRARAEAVRVVKLFFAPRFFEWRGVRLGDPILDPVFETIADRGFSVLIHVGDPDIWFERKYTDRAFYGSKADQYPPFVRRLRQYPQVKFQAAHMAGDPEHPEHLAALLEEFPNLYLDTAATKWMVRELSRRRDDARHLFLTYSHRILFGSDQVVVAPEEAEPHRYRARYWAYQLLLETDVTCTSPIPDPDAGEPVLLRGLDLPEDVLGRIYWENAHRVHGFG